MAVFAGIILGQALGFPRFYLYSEVGRVYPVLRLGFHFFPSGLNGELASPAPADE